MSLRATLVRSLQFGAAEARAHFADDVRRIAAQRGIHADQIQIVVCVGCGIFGDQSALTLGFGHFPECEALDRNLRFKTRAGVD